MLWWRHLGCQPLVAQRRLGVSAGSRGGGFKRCAGTRLAAACKKVRARKLECLQRAAVMKKYRFSLPLSPSQVLRLPVCLSLLLWHPLSLCLSLSLSVPRSVFPCPSSFRSPCRSGTLSRTLATSLCLSQTPLALAVFRPFLPFCLFLPVCLTLCVSQPLRPSVSVHLRLSLHTVSICVYVSRSVRLFLFVSVFFCLRAPEARSYPHARPSRLVLDLRVARAISAVSRWLRGPSRLSASGCAALLHSTFG